MRVLHSLGMLTIIAGIPVLILRRQRVKLSGFVIATVARPRYQGIIAVKAGNTVKSMYWHSIKERLAERLIDVTECSLQVGFSRAEGQVSVVFSGHEPGHNRESFPKRYRLNLMERVRRESDQ
jgi:hypothetical protein